MPLQNWTTEGTNLKWGSELVSLRGTSWFGFETPDFVVNGLWVHDIDFYFQLLKNMGVNALRVPFSSEWILFNFDQYTDQNMITATPSLNHLKSIEILDRFFDKAEEYGMMILLDLHRLHKEYISELWYSPTDNIYTTDTFFQTWTIMLDRYLNRTNLMGIDLLNEPHGRATYGNGDPTTDWKLFVEYMVPKIIDQYPSRQFLIFVEGINWGHTFADYRTRPINLQPKYMQQIVFSPHVYGLSVVPSTSLDAPTLYSQWDYDYGFLANNYDKVVIPGEWGGKTSIDSQWMTIFSNYLLERPIHSNFFWSLGPNSGDVAGLLYDDWTNIDPFKLNLLRKMVPNPTTFLS